MGSQKIVHILRARRLMHRSAGLRLRRRKVPRQTFPVSARLRYQALLTDLRRGLGVVLEEVRAALPGLLAQAAQERGGLRTDATVEELQALFARLRLVFLRMHPLATTQEVLQGVAKGIDVRQAAEHQKQLKAALGVELTVPEPWRKAVISDFVAQNQDLVTSLTDGALDSFRTITSTGIRQGLRVEDIAAQLEDRLGVTKGKAALLARDQSLKLFGELTSLRQQNVGITQYSWSTSKDERTRPDHAELEGTVQSWGDPPIVDKRTGRRAAPGLDYQCRCVALPLIPEEYFEET